MFKGSTLLQRIKMEQIRALRRAFEQMISPWNQASEDSKRKYSCGYFKPSACIRQLLNIGSGARTRTIPRSNAVGWTATPSTRPN